MTSSSCETTSLACLEPSSGLHCSQNKTQTRGLCPMARTFLLTHRLSAKLPYSVPGAHCTILRGPGCSTYSPPSWRLLPQVVYSWPLLSLLVTAASPCTGPSPPPNITCHPLPSHSLACQHFRVFRTIQHHLVSLCSLFWSFPTPRLGPSPLNTNATGDEVCLPNFSL